jgi:hypothetical protein
LANSTNSQIELVESRSKALQRVYLDLRYLALGWASFAMLDRADKVALAKATAFCCFVGHGRSGGTLAGALLNAHPNVVISNELHALRRLRLGLSFVQLCRLIHLVSKRQAERGSIGGGGYMYRVSGQWQGRHQEIAVIGDRKAGATAHEILAHPFVLDVMDRKVALLKKFIHVVRNPFDTIATTVNKTQRKNDESADSHLNREITNYFARCQAIQAVKNRYGESAMYFLHHEALIADPRAELTALCRFLAVQAHDDYLVDCSRIVNKEPNRTRISVNWPTAQIARVYEEINAYAWLRDYGQDSAFTAFPKQS